MIPCACMEGVLVPARRSHQAAIETHEMRLNKSHLPNTGHIKPPEKFAPAKYMKKIWDVRSACLKQEGCCHCHADFLRSKRSCDLSTA